MKHILVVSTTGMGDCLWGTPAIRALKRSFPEAKIDFLVNVKWRPLFDNNPNIDRLMEWSHHWYRYLPLGLRLMLNTFSYDAVLIFHSNRSIRRLLPFVRYSELWCHQDFDWIPEKFQIRFNGSVHGIQRRFALLEKAGARQDGSQMELFFDEDDRKKTSDYLKEEGFLLGEYVYLNVGASLGHKQWLDDRFIELADRILNKTSFNIILGGGPEDKIRSRNIAEKLEASRVADACGRPIRANAGLIAQARLMVTTDTGPMHIALAVKVPTVALFGPTLAAESGPYEIPDELCDLIQSPLTGSVPPDGDRIEDYFYAPISVDMVWEKVQKKLATQLDY
ncbi:MAG: glycosyltransferase family 9 protein [Nitrospinota bacterium]|nr:glycosyltransferase family 9 protein [Nitrospinota bacterium]